MKVKMKVLKYLTLTVIIVMCFVLSSCANGNEANSTSTGEETHTLDIQNDNTNTDFDSINNDQEETKVELNEVYNIWAGNYSTVENSDISGIMILSVDEDNFCYANIDIESNEGRLKARLFVAVEGEMLVLSLVSYEDGSTIDKFQEGDVVLCLKNEDGKVKTMINLNEQIGTWQELFIK